MHSRFIATYFFVAGKFPQTFPSSQQHRIFQTSSRLLSSLQSSHCPFKFTTLSPPAPIPRLPFQKTQTLLPFTTIVRPFHSTRSPFIFQSGLGRGQVSRHRLGAVPEPKVAKVKDPLGIEAKQKRLESQLDALKEGKDFDPFQHLTPEQRTQQELHFQEMEKFKTLHSWLDFMFSQSSTYFIFWFALSFSALGGSWWFYTKYMIDPDKPRELIALSNLKLQKAIDGVDDEDDKLSMRRKMKLQSNAAEIAQSIAKYNSPNYIESIAKQTHGSVTGSLKNFDPPPASSWESRKPVLLAYLNSGYSFPDYVGGGHFHIYHNGKDMVPNILKQIEHDNPGMSFTFQILSPYEMHQMLNQPLYRPRTMKQLDSDAENNVDSSISPSALLALDAVTQAQAQLKSNSTLHAPNDGKSKNSEKKESKL